MMKVDVSQPLPLTDGGSIFEIEQVERQPHGYLKDFWRSFSLIYLKHKWFNDKHWKSAFCSSSFDSINKYPNIFLIYRTLLLVITIFDLTYGIATTRPVHEWAIYYTHLTLLITFIAIVFQFLITYRVNFYRGADIVPRHSLQYIHITFILISLGSGLAVCLLYWTVIYKPFIGLYYPKIILDHGILWFLLLIDIFLFTRLPIYMIDFIPFLLFAILYGLFTVLVFLFKSKFSNDRIGFIYRALDFNSSPVRVIIQLLLFVSAMPIGITFILWNLFRLRRSIDVRIPNERNTVDTNIIA